MYQVNWNSIKVVKIKVYLKEKNTLFKNIT